MVPCGAAWVLAAESLGRLERQENPAGRRTMDIARWRSALAAAALTATALAGAAPASAQDGAKPLAIATNADPDVLDLTESRDPPTSIATMNNLYDSLI